MNKIELRRKVLLSAQRALWGMIYPSIRAIAVGFEGTKKLEIVYYLDREPNEDDYENISEVTSEMCADIDFEKVKERCVYTNKTISELDSLVSWVYIRKE